MIATYEHKRKTIQKYIDQTMENRYINSFVRKIEIAVGTQTANQY